MMKRVLLVLLGFFIMISTVEAKEGANTTTKIKVENSYDDAVTFIEKGIKFHIFLNGDFDFNTRRIRKRRNYRVPIYRDYRGRINRIGNVFISYNYNGNVRKIGTVYMSYRRGRLTRVGNLRINYNRWGDPRFYGEVRYNDSYYGNNYYNTNYYSSGFNINLGVICAYDDPYFYRREFRNNYRQFREDKNFYYYRARPNVKVSRNKILKRRKPVKKVVKKRAYKKSSQTKKRRRF